MRIAIIGGGYVGLVSGACFAEFGVSVAVVEADTAKRQMLLDGKIPIYEPGLDKLVADNVAAQRLTFPATLEEGIRAPKRCSSPSARPAGAATVMRT